MFVTFSVSTFLKVQFYRLANISYNIVRKLIISGIRQIQMHIPSHNNVTLDGLQYIVNVFYICKVGKIIIPISKLYAVNEEQNAIKLLVQHLTQSQPQSILYVFIYNCELLMF
jgi:hypothetical protein